jgi:hypothetical protein
MFLIKFCILNLTNISVLGEFISLFQNICRIFLVICIWNSMFQIKKFILNLTDKEGGCHLYEHQQMLEIALLE